MDKWLVVKPRSDNALELSVQDEPPATGEQFELLVSGRAQEAVVVSPFGIHVFKFVDAEIVADKLVSLASLIRREVPR